MDTQMWYMCTVGILFSFKKERNSDKHNTCFPLPPGEDTVKRPLSINQEGALTRHGAAGTLTLDFPASQNCWEINALFNSAHPIYGIFIIAAWMD